jgi:alpha-D-xyloside xylohydrolase
MVRALFVEFPEDPGSWAVDNEYLYGSSLLVAPLLHAGESARNVYLPPGTWIDCQDRRAYAGGWQKIEAGDIPEIILVRDGAAIPRIALAQCTQQMDWSKLELTVFAKNAATAKGLVFLPGEIHTHEVALAKSGNRFKLEADPLAGKVAWQISAAEVP